jgi:hypothetical protein
MKNQVIRSTAIVGLFLIMAVVSVQAQTPTRVEVQIPFDFSAGKAQLKAGTYIVKQRTGNVLAISSADGKTNALISAPLTIGSRDAKAGERLVFNQYDNQYFLSQVWISADTGRQLFTSGAEVKTAREFKLARKDAQPRRIEIAAKK